MHTRHLGIGVWFLAGWIAVGAGLADGAVFTVTTTAADGAGTLRQAILDANTNDGTDTIAFAIPQEQCSAAGVCTIHLGSSPAMLTGPVLVDGTTQPRYGTAPANVCATAEAPSYMRVEITVPDIPDFVFSLDVAAAAEPSTFRGVAIAGGRSLRISAPGAHRVYCNHIGADGPGTGTLYPAPHLWNPPTVTGVTIEGAAQGVIVGTDGDGSDDGSERNVISGVGTGVFLNANANNRIAGNYIGVGADGTTPLGASNGIYVRQSSAANRIGTDFDGVSDQFEYNVIGHCGVGIRLEDGGAGNEVTGNWIGVDASGAPAGNFEGIAVTGGGGARHVAYNRIESNTTGIAVDDGAATFDAGSRGNCFTENGTAFSHDGSAAIPFERNWWGATDGPSGLGTGAGDAVVVSGSGSVDFTPWETAGCPAPEPGAISGACAAVAALALAKPGRRFAPDEVTRFPVRAKG